MSTEKTESAICSLCGEFFESYEQLGPHYQYSHNNAPWQDKELLQELYKEKGLITTEIAEKFGCTDATITNWLDKFGIDTRNKGLAGATKLAPSMYTDKHGYERVSIHQPSGSQKQFGIHQLLLIAEGKDPNKVFGKNDHDTHHKNQIPWDNRKENLELIDSNDHLDIHRPQSH